MKTRKWIVSLCVYVPLLAISLLMFATSFHSNAAQHVLQTKRQSAPAPPHAFAITLLAPAAVNGQVLEPGEYTVKWWLDAGVVMLSFAQADVIQATAHGKVETRHDSARYSVVLTRPTASGINAMVEMQFEGRQSALVLTSIDQAAVTARGNVSVNPQEVAR